MNVRLTLALLAGCAAFGFVRAQSVTDPHITTWLTSKSAQYARVYETTSDKTSGNAVSTWPRSGLTNSGGGQSTSAYADVQRVAYSANYVYIYTTGLASYTMGNWLSPSGNVFMFWPTNRAAIHRIPRNPTIPTTKSKANGVGGVWINGVYLWENGDAQSYSTTSATVSFNGDGIWNRLAGVAEAFNFDSGNGHQPSSGAYHTHINPIALRYQVGDNVTYNSSTKTYSEASTPTTHSPILGWALDGLPVYGPYGYSSPMDATSGIRRMTTGFQKRDGTNGSTNLSSTGRTTLPVWAASVQGKSQTLSSSQYGPNVNATYPLGTFAEDYDYMGDLGKTQGVDFDLNRQNVRYCVTPEYPSGTYAYFVSLDSSGTTAFPDVINQEFFGATSGGQGTVNSITETVTEYHDSGPAAAISVTATASGNGVGLTWNSAEGATYRVESSANNSTWTTLSSSVTSDGLSTSYTAASVANYYRVTLTAIATYDTGGTYGTPVGKTGTVQYGTVATAPSITTQPTSATVTAGTSVTFTVVAGGTAPLTYQWQKGGTAVSGATSASYTIANTATTDTGSYTCVVSNTAGSVTTNAATLTVNAAAVAPSITTQPTGASVTTGTSVTFTIVASGTSPLTYQWQKGGTSIGGATSSSYTIASAATTDAGNYTCVVSNTAGSVTSNPAVLAVSSAVVAPAITTQPSSVSIPVGSSATFSVAASGTSPLTYQWRKGGVTITGATSASYTVASATTTDAGSYTCVVSNSAGSATSNTATLTVTVVAPSITTQPASAAVSVGSGVVFAVAASGTSPLTYQWYKGVSAIAGATSASYSLASAQLTDAGSYTCVITNSGGTATSSAATLAVTSPVVAPTIASQPTSVSATVGDTVTFSVIASGTAPFTYQWAKGGAVIPGATAATYSLANVQSIDAGTYACAVSNSAGSATSNSATLTVSAAAVAPSIAVQPASAAVTAGANVSFSVVANGTAPLAYQWARNGSAISGARSATYSLTAVQASDAASFTCTVSNSVGSITTTAATLTVSTAAIAPSLTQQPSNVTVAEGGVASFTVVASGTATLSYQWYKGVVAINAANSATYTLSPVALTDAAGYTCVVTNSAGSATSATATLTVNPSSGGGSGSGGGTTASTARLINVAVRTPAGGSAGTPIAGFVLSGTGAGKKLVIRGVGPSLGVLRVSGGLADPLLQLWTGSTLVTTNDNWNAADQASFDAVGAFPLNPNSADAGLVVTLPPGAYTAPVIAPNNSQGIVLLECYDAATSDNTLHLVNASARAHVGTGDSVLIPSFVISGEGSIKLLIRAVGPQLFALNVNDALVDPQMTVYAGSTAVVSNDNWSDSANASTIATAAASVGAFPFPSGSKDAAVIVTLPAGAYSAVVSGVGGSTGTALVEVYVLP